MYSVFVHRRKPRPVMSSQLKERAPNVEIANKKCHSVLNLRFVITKLKHNYASGELGTCRHRNEMSTDGVFAFGLTFNSSTFGQKSHLLFDLDQTDSNQAW